MNTFFNYQPSAEEIIHIIGKLWKEEDYLKVISNPQSAYIDLWKLFLYRKDYKTAEKYFRKIKTFIIRNELRNIIWEM